MLSRRPISVQGLVRAPETWALRREKNRNKYKKRVLWFGLVGMVRNRWFVHGKHSGVPVETETIGNLRSIFYANTCGHRCLKM